MKSFREYINLIENAQHSGLGEGTSHHVRMVMNLAADLMKQHGFRAVGQLGVNDLKQIAQKTDATLHDVCIILNIDHADTQTTEEVVEAEQPVQVNDAWFKQGSFQTYKKADPIKYAVPGQPGTVQTLEGPVKHSAQARIITGPKGEQYPVEPEKFAQLYDDNGNGTATPKKIPKLAKLADHNGVLHTSWGDLQYTAGNDYIVRHGTNDYGAVKKDIFAQTYALPQGVAEEELDEAGTPDAVRRIEQLVQYK